MIAILIVSHSAEVARGVKALAEQMSKGAVPILAAGGMPDGDLGTSVDVIATALEEAKEAEGVLVLVDMGSAVMSAEMAIELSGLQCHLSAAPLVEGAIVAATEATRPGVTLAAVAAAAEQALETKGIARTSEPAVAAAPAVVANDASLETTLTITNESGLHMRPANLFIQTAGQFKASIRGRNLDRPERPEGNIKSMLDVMKLGVAKGQRIALRAEGDDASEALAALSALVTNNFGEHSA